MKRTSAVVYTQDSGDEGRGTETGRVEAAHARRRAYELKKNKKQKKWARSRLLNRLDSRAGGGLHLSLGSQVHLLGVILLLRGSAAAAFALLAVFLHRLERRHPAGSLTRVRVHTLD